MLFEKFQCIFLDFVSVNEPITVGDAKYVRLNEQYQYTEGSEKALSIYYKTITYMYRFNSVKGFLLFPNENDWFNESYKIKDTKGILTKVGMPIPKGASDFKVFSQIMKKNEEELLKVLLML